MSRARAGCMASRIVRRGKWIHLGERRAKKDGGGVGGRGKLQRTQTEPRCILGRPSDPSH